MALKLFLNLFSRICFSPSSAIADFAVSGSLRVFSIPPDPTAKRKIINLTKNLAEHNV
jgi:hypothetical protein